jgi:signal recognition particle subunit SRP54
MFDSLQASLSDAFRKIAGQARLTEANMRDGLQLVQRALLEADVSYQVVKTFMARVTEQAVGEQVLKSLRPKDLLFAIVFRELVELMGPVDTSLHLRDFTKVMLCGLQGSGKTTTCAKLANMLKRAGRKPLMVAADLQRPAAILQLQTLGQQIDVPVIADTQATDPVALCQRAVTDAQSQGADVVLFDTAGRLHIDDELMQQLRRIDDRIQPHQIYLVVDGNTGQDAVNSAKAFNDALELNGVIMTKLDGDMRGGAVLSVKAVTGVPIKLLGTGEHLQDLEEFRPEGMASRILGQGDIVGLAQQAQKMLDQEELRKREAELAKGEITLETFRDMMVQSARLGPITKLLGMLPGMGALREMMNQGDADPEKEMRRLRGIIDSMTPEERRNPKRLIDQSRRRRIAEGAGVQPHEVNELVKNFDGMAAMMQQMAGLGMRDRMKAMQQIQQQVMTNPGGMFSKVKKGTGARLTNEQKARNRKLREKEMRRKKREERKGQ